MRIQQITVLLLSVSVFTHVWADEVTIDFESTIEEFDVGSNGLPARIETQRGYTFYSSGSIAQASASSTFIVACPAPGCELIFSGGWLDSLVSFDVASVNPFGGAPGSGTIEVTGQYWDDPERLDPTIVQLPFNSTWATHTFWSGLQADEDWQALERVEIRVLTNNSGFFSLDNVVIDTGHRHVEIDVLPGDEANVVYPNKDGELPVAILSAADFDATQVNVGNLIINSQRFAGELDGVEDVDGLHGPDLVARFDVQESAIFCDDTELTISGQAYGYENILGFGAIDASECESGGCHAY